MNRVVDSTNLWEWPIFNIDVHARHSLRKFMGNSNLHNLKSNIIIRCTIIRRFNIQYQINFTAIIFIDSPQTRVPARWLSLESLVSKTYTTKSDV